ncbi:MAG TPA: GNAT family protein [Aggregatilineaceae bacterium]|nr:GNAT family protein [Aggregatilineaceae bacterium]
MILAGVLVDLVPYGADFLAHEREWLNGPMRVWWGLDGLMSETGFQQRREFLASLPPGSQARFGIRAKDGNPIGVFVLKNIDSYNRTAEVGAGIGDPNYWSGGFGSDAMLLIVDYGFRQLDLRRLCLTTAGTNFRAQRQIEKCGFIREGACRLGLLAVEGRGYQDILWYSLMRDDWPGREVMLEKLGLREKARQRGYID